mgnify:CR=1 FL=1
MEEGPPVVAKFYRPERWSDAAILEEHAFVAELAEREIPVVPALTLNGATLHSFGGFKFAVFPRRGGGGVGRHRLRAGGGTQPPQPEPIPIWSGGTRARGVRRAVESGDGWSPFPNPPIAAGRVKTPAITNLDELAVRLKSARAYASEIGRTDPLTVCFAAFNRDDDPAAYADLGIEWLAVQFDGCTTRAEWIDRLCAFAARVGGPAR